MVPEIRGGSGREVESEKIDPYGNNWWCAQGGGVSAEDDYMERYYSFYNKWTSATDGNLREGKWQARFRYRRGMERGKKRSQEASSAGARAELPKRTGNRVRESASRRSACSGGAAQSGASDPAWLRGPGHKKIFEASFPVAAPEISEERVDEENSLLVQLSESPGPPRHRQTLCWHALADMFSVSRGCRTSFSYDLHVL
jgi:hypothetical protein